MSITLSMLVQLNLCATGVPSSPVKAFLISLEMEENQLSSSQAGRCPAELEPEQRLAAQRAFPLPYVRDLGLLFGQLQWQISSRYLGVASYLPPDLQDRVSSCTGLVLMVLRCKWLLAGKKNP